MDEQVREAPRGQRKQREGDRLADLVDACSRRA
jgi:hypothetical protein